MLGSKERHSMAKLSNIKQEEAKRKFAKALGDLV